MKAAPFPGLRIRTVTDLKAYLEEHFQPEPIGPTEDLIQAHRRAAAVHLAHRIIATIIQSDNTYTED